uniref:ATP-dependent DNA helicase n=1 Tax=Romanomermis culicivorax TaxID=13658 RepID=A0A915ID50_ROMCU
MRVNPNEADFAKFLEQVGNGKNLERNTNLMIVPDEMRVFTREELIEFCFPRLNLEHTVEDIDSLSNSAILSPTNLSVEVLNLEILTRIPGQGRIFPSTDSLYIAGDNDSVLQHNINGLQLNVRDNVLENIHLRMPSGFPPHLLHLK